MVWVIAQYVPNAKLSGEEVFGTGDLLPVASILLLNGSADIRLEEKAVGFFLVSSEVLFLVSGIVALFMYVVFKTSALELLKKASKDEVETLWAYAKFSGWYVAAAICLTVPVKARLLRVVAWN